MGPRRGLAGTATAGEPYQDVRDMTRRRPNVRGRAWKDARGAGAIPLRRPAMRTVSTLPLCNSIRVQTL
jgi:hypothetical protein